MSKFTLFGETIEFSKAADRYYKMLKVYEAALDMATDDFANFYKNSSCIADVLDNYAEALYDISKAAAVDPLFKCLINIEIYDVSRERFEDECWDLSGAEPYYDEIVGVYNDIVGTEEYERDYRAMRKASRGRVIGGGFGFGGALKGIATAGAMNAVTGLGHTIVNSIGNARSSATASKAKTELYNNSETFDILNRGVRECIKDIYLLFMNLVNEYKENEGEEIWYDGSVYNSEKADALFKNSSVVEGKEKELLLKALRFCPDHKALLLSIFRKYEEERKNIYEIAKYYKVDLSVAFDVILSSMYDEEAQQSNEKAHAAKKKIEAFMADFDIKESLTLDILERDCLDRICQLYCTLLPGETQDFLESFKNFDALDKNKTHAIMKHGIWELCSEYNIKLSAQDKEKIVSTFIDTHKKLEYTIILQKTCIIMDGLNLKKSKSLERFEYNILKSLSKEYSNIAIGEASKIVNAIKDCKVSNESKAKYVHDFEIWELFKEYNVGFDDEERLNILYRKYKTLISEGALTENIQDRLYPVVEMFVAVEGNPQKFAPIKVSIADFQDDLVAYAKNQLKKVNLHGTFDFEFSEVDDWGARNTYHREDYILLRGDEGFNNLLKGIKDFLKSSSDIKDFEDIYLILSSGIKAKSRLYTFFTTQNIYGVVPNGNIFKTSITNFETILSNGVLKTVDGEYFGDIFITKGWDNNKIQQMGVAINDIVNYMQSLIMSKDDAMSKISQYYAYTRSVILGESIESEGDKDKNWFDDSSSNGSETDASENDTSENYLTKEGYYYLVDYLMKKCEIEPGFINGYYLPTMNGFDKRLVNIKRYYAPISIEEIPLLIYDSSMFGGAKQGYLITNTHMYINNQTDSKIRIDLKDISEFSVAQYKSGGFILNVFVGDKKYRAIDTIDKIKDEALKYQLFADLLISMIRKYSLADDK